ncbi:LEAF RUST 10 DISEASE-RESISTANCE LOCUS RECEPTOR-LIKE PROTEIN KINASE-like 2.1 isoform X2 [Jatropha curcas]|uniref:LEAF RUST 10 DISEASE-RESISTANCE LOCUS RECEPTOR-LIKE PROTEIN KINASE-like 2.1 isoform X2 n=1 Tax=Jatropha curcas TaxID=180498 RepID=UPI001895AB74|nr:LEAF RUST 10 DISEASE-RESISTANCE LOCUS RECEPTOR-LIKE PROTEIN KINASE-like 2.1 isoform X2 [Jatropha curcas]
MSKPLFFFFFLLLLLFFFVICFGDNSANLPSICSTHHCGNSVEIKYPFWYKSATTPNQYCGYRGFGISCSNDEPTLPLQKNDYYVKNINYARNTITLVDIDAAGQVCPRARHNVTFEDLPLNYTNSDSNLTFYFNCTTNPFSNPMRDIKCLRFDTLKSYVVMGGSGMEDVDWNGRCKEKVVVTVMMTEIRNRGLISGFGGAMNQGFVLDWSTVRDCGGCEAHGGFCGYAEGADQFLCFCSDGSVRSNCNKDSRRVTLKVVIGIVAVVVVLGILVTCGGLIYCRKKIPTVFLRSNNQDFEAFLENHGPLSVKRYSFSEVKKMTNFFKDKLGQGGYGIVYKGKLKDGHFVAVKVLNASKGEGEEFINEVASISRTSHINIVTLLGFCLEGQKRALIYEFISNGSLENFICSQGILKSDYHLGWEIMHEIAIGIARGLEYLHRGCKTRIVHFDIKPHNILLDENFCPKISDFGLAKLYTKKESILSMLETRGTIGYIAPEVFSRNFGGVSYKSDVYSYGMLVLETVGGREKDEVGTNDSSNEKYFPYWIYKRIELGNESKLYGETSTEEKEIVRKMTLVGLWCIQTNPSDRPSMSKVIEMLEGSSESLKIPPMPLLFSTPESPPLCSFTTSTA